MGERLSDEEVACNMIKNSRRQNKKYIDKTISTRIGADFDGRAISARLYIQFNPSTESVSCTHALVYSRSSIYPSTNEKLVCTNAHALEQLEKSRACSREGKRKRNAERKAK